MRLQIAIRTISQLGLALTVIFQSCQKDQANSVGISDAESRIKKVVFDSGYISVGFTTLNYTDDKLVSILWDDSVSSVPMGYNISYPTQNQVKVINIDFKYRYQLYSYSNNNKLVTIKFVSSNTTEPWYNRTLTLHTNNNKIDSVTSDGLGSDPSRAIAKYKYDGNGNILQFAWTQNSYIWADTISYNYDNKPNLLQKNQLYFLIQIGFSTWETIIDKAIPYLFSKNNVVSQKSSSSYSYSPTTINYKTDSIGRITDFFDGQQFSSNGWRYYY